MGGCFSSPSAEDERNRFLEQAIKEVGRIYADCFAFTPKIIDMPPLFFRTKSPGLVEQR